MAEDDASIGLQAPRKRQHRSARTEEAMDQDDWGCTFLDPVHLALKAISPHELPGIVADVRRGSDSALNAIPELLCDTHVTSL